MQDLGESYEVIFIDDGRGEARPHIHNIGVAYPNTPTEEEHVEPEPVKP